MNRRRTWYDLAENTEGVSVSKTKSHGILTISPEVCRDFKSLIIKLGYLDSNQEMTESESVALPFGDSPSVPIADND